MVPTTVSGTEQVGLGIIGARGFGQTVMAQVARSPHFSLIVVCDSSLDKARATDRHRDWHSTR